MVLSFLFCSLFFFFLLFVICKFFVLLRRFELRNIKRTKKNQSNMTHVFIAQQITIYICSLSLYEEIHNSHMLNYNIELMHILKRTCIGIICVINLTKGKDEIKFHILFCGLLTVKMRFIIFFEHTTPFLYLYLMISCDDGL